MATNQGALYFVCLPMKDAVHFNSPSPWYVNAKLGVWHFHVGGQRFRPC